jgi:ADP-ribose pyrophosphatase
MNWKTIATEYISKHIYFNARKDTCQKPDGQIVDPYFVVEMPKSVCAVAITADDKVILVKQYRHPVGKVLIELPGGFIDEGEDELQAIERELLEETGFKFDTITYLAQTAANPGVLNNYTNLYLATGGQKISEQQLDANEDIEMMFVPIDEVKKMLLRNEFDQAMHTVCLFYAFDKLGGSK